MGSSATLRSVKGKRVILAVSSVRVVIPWRQYVVMRHRIKSTLYNIIRTTFMGLHAISSTTSNKNKHVYIQ